MGLMKKLIKILVGLSVLQTIWIVYRDILIERRMRKRDQIADIRDATETERWKARVRMEQEHLDLERKITDVTLEAGAARIHAEATAARFNEAAERANEAAEAYHRRMTELLED